LGLARRSGLSSMARVIKPRMLRLGSTIAIVAPAWPPKPDHLQKSLEFFVRHGYKPIAYHQIRKTLGYLAGDDKSRAAAIIEAFADDRIDGIFCARGGYGSIRLLSHLDFEIIKRYPKPFVGYSDITVLLLAIYKKCGMVTFHGPMPSVEFGKPLRKYTTEHFFMALESTEPVGKIKLPQGYRCGKINGGCAEGNIVGGNLSLICKLIGTGFLPSFKDKIVFLEDTDEQPHRIDGYLAQLILATDFADANGYLIGEFTNAEPAKDYPKAWIVADVLKDYLSKLGKPVIYNYPCGHGKEKITIPIGVKAVIDADHKTLEILEAGVRR
jgi:muramoyltetrapeptide carboxypeptidase